MNKDKNLSHLKDGENTEQYCPCGKMYHECNCRHKLTKEIAEIRINGVKVDTSSYCPSLEMPKECKWVRDLDIDDHFYSTSCGKNFFSFDLGINGTGIDCCPCCGGLVEEVSINA